MVLSRSMNLRDLVLVVIEPAAMRRWKETEVVLYESEAPPCLRFLAFSTESKPRYAIYESQRLLPTSIRCGRCVQIWLNCR